MGVLLWLFLCVIIGKIISSPLGTVNVLDGYQQVLQSRFSPKPGAAGITSEEVLAAYDWLFCYLFVESKEKMEQELAKGKVKADTFARCIIQSHTHLY